MLEEQACVAVRLRTHIVFVDGGSWRNKRSKCRKILCWILLSRRMLEFEPLIAAVVEFESVNCNAGMRRIVGCFLH